jgi:hypothetical protein
MGGIHLDHLPLATLSFYAADTGCCPPRSAMTTMAMTQSSILRTIFH